MRLIGEPMTEQQLKIQKELEKAIKERLERIEQQCTLLDKLNHKLMNFFK